jgi:hypothetical protein
VLTPAGAAADGDDESISLKISMISIIIVVDHYCDHFKK